MGRSLGWIAVVVIQGLASLAAGVQVQPREAVEHSAIVEDISEVDGLTRLDLVGSGQRIDLGEAGRIVLGFFASCWQESIVGGRIFIEDRHSRVEGGEMIRRRVECDPSGLPRSDSAGPLTQRAVVPVAEELPAPDLILFGRSPVVLSRGADPFLVFERLDMRAPAVRAEFTRGQIDFCDRNIELEPGGLYRFATGGVSIIARVDALAEPGHAPVIGRLLMFR